ncbi:efflux RND transporter periplasmic adaptor subunit [Dyella lutea]|uniref:Efflux RND transporter periplasmic adaptor subunit n=1 Tax=Dyella lutea TaxID=2950441 RepID=A0ABT1F8W6_9GAMM|nr:efflux RND transporter periplasmic adaptor subunit [Dyella lutea]MCP1373815.1 efflux RND transporter periplasmic adaptor subunit [Dyella lutea]
MTSKLPSLRPLLLVSPLLLTALLAACGGGSGGDDDGAAPSEKGVVAVQTVKPTRAAFHATVEAWGRAVADPARSRTLSLGHGGQVEALAVAPGQRVKHGQALLTIAPDPAARAAVAQAQSALTLAKNELDRTTQLAAQQLATQSQLAAARKNLADAEATLQAQQALGGGSARETLTAPSDGVVTTLAVARGERFAANAPLLGFAPDHALIAELGVPPVEGRRLHAGQAVVLDDVYGDHTKLTGKLLVVGRAVDPQSRLLPLRASMPADATLADGTELHARIQVSDISAWSVPRAAVLHDDHGDYLFQMEGDKAHRVDVTLSSPDGDPVGVDGPLDAKAKVIVQGVYELADGDRVQEAGK